MTHLQEFFKEQRAKRSGVTTDERELAKQLKAIEKAAAAAVEQDLSSGAVKYSGAASGRGPQVRA